MSKLDDIEKEIFLQKHLRHRLTLLRTLGARVESKFDFSSNGDIYRCIKDSNLISIRLLMDFLGIKGSLNNGNFSLIEIIVNNKNKNDIRIDEFNRKLLTIEDVLESDREILAGVYVRADKELAHLTNKFNDEFNEEKALIHAAKIIENLIRIHLYEFLEVPFPEIDK
jgi:hypothetical protein